LNKNKLKKKYEILALALNKAQKSYIELHKERDSLKVIIEIRDSTIQDYYQKNLDFKLKVEKLGQEKINLEDHIHGLIMEKNQLKKRIKRDRRLFVSNLKYLLKHHFRSNLFLPDRIAIEEIIEKWRNKKIE